MFRDKYHGLYYEIEKTRIEDSLQEHYKFRILFDDVVMEEGIKKYCSFQEVIFEVQEIILSWKGIDIN